MNMKRQAKAVATYRRHRGSLRTTSYHASLPLLQLHDTTRRKPPTSSLHQWTWTKKKRILTSVQMVMV